MTFDLLGIMTNPRVDPLYLRSTGCNVNFCDMNLTLYPKLGTNSQKALARKSGKWGKPYTYRPRGTLLDRLGRETGMTISQVRSQLEKEREYLLKQNSLP